jgi:hypothetical protein
MALYMLKETGIDTDIARVLKYSWELLLKSVQKRARGTWLWKASRMCDVSDPFLKMQEVKQKECIFTG